MNPRIGYGVNDPEVGYYKVIQYGTGEGILYNPRIGSGEGDHEEGNGKPDNHEKMYNEGNEGPQLEITLG